MLDDNWDVLRPLEVFGGRIYRRYRIVARPVPSDGAWPAVHSPAVTDPPSVAR